MDKEEDSFSGDSKSMIRELKFKQRSLILVSLNSIKNYKLLFIINLKFTLSLRKSEASSRRTGREGLEQVTASLVMPICMRKVSSGFSI
jgi:hypothetical protein